MDQPPSRIQDLSPAGDPLQPGTAQGTESTREVPPRDYLERKASGWCTYSSACRRRAEGWPSPTHALCKQHRSKKQRTQRAWVSERRSAATGSGKCAGCRKPSKTYRCPGCKIRNGATLPAPRSVDAGVDAKDAWRRDGNGWERYRGKGQRGAPSAAVNDEQDLIAALSALEKGRQALVYAHSADVAKLGRIMRDDARKAAAGVLAMAAGFVIEVVSRNDPQRARQLRKLEREIAEHDAAAAASGAR